MSIPPTRWLRRAHAPSPPPFIIPQGYLSQRVLDTNAALAFDDLGRVALKQGNSDEAERYFVNSLYYSARIDDKMRIVEALEGLAATAAVQQHYGRTAMLYGVTATLRQSIHAPAASEALQQDNRDLFERSCAVAAEAVGDDVFAAAWLTGQETPSERVVDEMLEHVNLLASP